MIYYIEVLSFDEPGYLLCFSSESLYYISMLSTVLFIDGDTNKITPVVLIYSNLVYEILIILFVTVSKI